MTKPMRLRRIEAGVYESRDRKFRVNHWHSPPGGNRPSWAVSEWDGEGWDFVCEVLTLDDARRYLSGENVFILS
jgi:hypothetical protein